MKICSYAALSFLLALLLSTWLVPTARAEVASPATVVRVVDGDTVEAQVADGREVPVRLIGIDAAEVSPAECRADEATESLRELVEGRPVNLVSDPTQDPVDQSGRNLAYVDRLDGLDVGEAQLGRGWGEVFVFERGFERQGTYVEAEAEAIDLSRGGWRLCGGDFLDLSMGGPKVRAHATGSFRA